MKLAANLSLALMSVLGTAAAADLSGPRILGAVSIRVAASANSAGADAMVGLAEACAQERVGYHRRNRAPLPLDTSLIRAPRNAALEDSPTRASQIVPVITLFPCA